MNIRLLVSDEKTLYMPFNPEAELSENVKKYIKSKAVTAEAGQSFSLNVISQVVLDEERFRAAVSNWIKEEKALYRRKEKETLHTFVAMLIVGSLLFLLSHTLQQQFEVMKYTLLPILGSLALSKAAGILILDIPVARAERWMLDEAEKKE